MPQEPVSYGYTLTNAFGGLLFSNPVSMATAPGDTNRLFVVERGGRVIVVTNLAAPDRTVFLDISHHIPPNYPTTEEEGLAAIAFHPQYANNRFFYAAFVVFTNGPAGAGRHQRVARFETSAANPNFAPATSEKPLITQRDEYVYHSYNDLEFGPDGYLYIAVGDEGGFNDPGHNSQRIDKDLFSGILRIDVDKRLGNLSPNPHPAVTTNYAIPRDNPFVGASSFNGSPVNPPEVRTEFYAVGLRNPYRIEFEPGSGVLFCGDVGEARVEDLDTIVKGGNYGWAFYEGSMRGLKPGLPSPPPAMVPIFPIVQYFHGTPEGGNSIIGGIVYQGDRLPLLTGAYIFGDYVTGNIWALRHSGTNVTSREFLTAAPGMTGFAADPRNGDVLLAFTGAGTIKRLVNNTNVTATLLPATLANTGAFSNLVTLSPHTGIVSYDLNVPFWSDNATKRRWFSVPNTNLTIGFNPTNNWAFPTGTVWIKHFDLLLTNDNPASAKRVETRFLVRNANGVYGATYRWGNSTSNATLVPEGGMDEAFTIRDGVNTRMQTWHYPSRAECLVCHTRDGGLALGFNTQQLNRDFNYGGITDNQIRALNHARYFNTNVPTINNLRALAHATNAAWSREYRVRSYLAVNCAQCHQPGGSARGLWDARITTSLPAAGIVNGALQDNGGDPNNRVVVPGSLSRSMLFSRISTFGTQHMPPLATTVIDSGATNLVANWIQTEALAFRTFAEWQMEHFNSTNSPAAAASADPDQDRASNLLEYLTGTHPLQAASFWNMAIRKSGTNAQISFVQIANRGFELQLSSAAAGNWGVLDAVANRPFFSATNRLQTITIPTTNTPLEFYRLRAFEP